MSGSSKIGLSQVEVIPSAFAEDLPKTMSPFEYVLETATQKAMAVYRAEIDNAERGEPALVLAADTVVVSHAGAVLEKPRSEREHLAMLTGLRGGAGAHRVYTAVTAIAPLEAAVSPGYALETSVEETLVRFDPKGESQSPSPMRGSLRQSMKHGESGEEIADLVALHSLG